ncbi:hypothetical protein ACJRPK_09440 [Aquimarina sp. 2-A2]
MGSIEDKKLKRKDQDKPLGSLGPKDKPKDISTTKKGSLKEKKEEKS